jgi:hypothetical protein
VPSFDPLDRAAGDFDKRLRWRAESSARLIGVGAFNSEYQTMRAAFKARGAMERTVTQFVMGDIPGTMLFDMRMAELEVHGWDLARAIGVDETLDADVVAALWAFIEPMDGLLPSTGPLGERAKWRHSEVASPANKAARTLEGGAGTWEGRCQQALFSSPHASPALASHGSVGCSTRPGPAFQPGSGDARSGALVSSAMPSTPWSTTRHFTSRSGSCSQVRPSKARTARS